MTTATDTVRAFVKDCFDGNGVNIDNVPKYFAPDAVFHDAMPGLEGVAGYQNLLRMLDGATETVEGAIQPHVIGDGDLVAIRWENKVRHTGELMGVPATNRVILLKGHEIYRVKGGQIVENWAIMDAAGMMAQIQAETA